MGLFDVFRKPKPEPKPKKPPIDKKLILAVCEEIWAETARPVLCYTLEPGEPGILESKVGGTPYLPLDMAWPLDSEGKPMDLLAQVDCSALRDLPDFPHDGVLQFFLARDDTFGIDFNDQASQKDFRVLYHETVDPSVTAEEVLAKRPPVPADDDECGPVARPCRIVFSGAEAQGMSDGDYRFDPLFARKWNERYPDDPVKDFYDAYRRIPEEEKDYQMFTQLGWDRETRHQLGGYPYFTQFDPRPGRCDDLDVLLFQLDSDYDGQGKKYTVLWGDAGIANFFISRDALKRRDFSRVCYNWDCC